MYFRQLPLIYTVYYAAVYFTFMILHSSGRISDTKCNEYTEFLYPSSRISFLLPPPFNSLRKFTCLQVENISKFIIGGRDANPGEYPYQVALGYESKTDGILWGCGGAIISEQFILTAAHCIQTRHGSPRLILMGDTKLADNAESKSRKLMDVIDTFVHPDYRAPVTYGDLALIKLESKLNFSTEIAPACLAQADDLLQNKTWTTVSGWGQLGEFEPQSETMQTVNLTFWNKTDCNTYFSDWSSKRSFPEGIIESQICAGDQNGNKDTCHGDSGSPLVQKHSNRCLYYILGVTQGGKPCGLSTPGIYTNVTSYLDWIESVVWPADLEENSNAIKTILGIPVKN